MKAKFVTGFVYETVNGVKEEIPFAHVYIPSTTNIFWSDENGLFVVDVKDKNKIEVSHKGYELDTMYFSSDTLFVKLK